MKLQSQVSRKVGDTEYKKSWIVIPNKLLELLKCKSIKGRRKNSKHFCLDKEIKFIK